MSIIMKCEQRLLNNLESPTVGFDRIIDWLLAALLAFMPFAFGTVQAWSEQIVIALSGVILLCFLLKLISRQDTIFKWSWSYLPIGLFILVAVFQLLELPAALVHILSTNTGMIKTQLLGQLADSERLLSSMTVSFYPNATGHNLRLVLSVAAVFVVVLNTYGSPDRIKCLLGSIVVIGAAVALLALAQDIFGNGKIYWFVPCYDNAYSGPFINHSNYSQFMNLSIGACIALLLVKLHEAFSESRITAPVVLEYLGSQSARVLWWLAAVVIVSAATIFVSLSRGGIISMLIAGGVTTLILTSRRSLKGRGWIMAVMALGAFVCVLYIGFDAVYDRLATLRDMHDAHGGRVQILKDIALAWTKFPILGTGLGTHEVVYPMFDRSTIAALAAHAENEYAQTIEETGLAGLIPLVVFAVMVWVAYARIIRRGRKPVSSAAYGLGFGLLAIMIHSLSDFGQHLPANAMLSAIFCALMLAIARLERGDDKTNIAVAPTHLSRLLCTTAGFVVLVLWSWLLLGANNARIAEGYWKKAYAVEVGLRKNDWQGSNERYVELLQNASAASNSEPGNVQYRFWLNAYRWYSLTRTIDPATGRLVLTPQAVQFAQRIVDELHKAIAVCPTYGQAWCLAGQLEYFVLDKPEGADRIRAGFQLAPCDEISCFIAGILDVEEENIDDSLKKFTRAVELDDSMFTSVADIYVNRLNRPDLALTTAGDNIGRLTLVANALADSKEHDELMKDARVQITELLKSRCQQPDAPAGAFASLANIYANKDANAEAIVCYQQALTLDYGQVHWRLRLARLLAEQQQVDEAIHEAKICLRLSPQLKAAENLIADLSVRSISSEH
jgi:tetratricopeptide (TPR) repeat protein